MNRTIALISTNYAIPAFGNLTEKRPPASIPFGGLYRLMDFALSNITNARISTVGFVTPYYYRSVLDHLGSGKGWGLDRKEGGLFVLPGTVFGTREESGRFLFRDIIHNLAFLERGDADYVLVSSGTGVFNIDYQPMMEQHELEGKPVTLLYKKMPAGEEKQGVYLTIDNDGRVTGMAHAGEGENLFLESFIVDKSWLMRLIRDYSAQGHLDFMQVLSQLTAEVPVGSFAFEGYATIVNNLQDYMAASMDLLRPEIRRDLFRRDRPISTKIHDMPPAHYVPGAEVERSIVSAGSVIEGRVENSLISRNVRIEKGALVKNSVLMDGCIVRSNAVLENVIADKRSEISAGATVKGGENRPCVLPRAQVI